MEFVQWIGVVIIAVGLVQIVRLNGVRRRARAECIDACDRADAIIEAMERKHR